MLIDIPSENVENFIEVLRKELPQSFFGCHYPVVSAYALDSYENALEKALKPVFVDLRGNLFIEGIADKHVPTINKLVANESLKTRELSDLISSSMSKEEALNLKFECPDDVELASLSECHLDEIYEIWVMKGVHTKTFLKYCFSYNDQEAYGVFCKTTGELLARCVRSYSGSLAALQTVEKARNKGYAKLLLKYATKKVAEKGYQACINVGGFNRNCLNAIHSVGYKDKCKTNNYWIVEK